MAFIYKITNDVNQKIYVGKTEFSIEKRFKEHCKDAFRDRNEKRPLYATMRKYGIEHFHVELLEETDNPEDREIYWIEKFGSFKHGYNATVGGDGKRVYNHEAIIEKLRENPYPSEVAKIFGCSRDTVRNLAKLNGILVKSRGHEQVNAPKKIKQFDKNNSYIQEFDSVTLAAKWCFENGKCPTLNSGVRGHIADVANNKRKSAYGYIWRYD